MPTLLLADESVTTQRVIALTFADESFRVVTVSDGQQAIDAMAAARPDIVLAGTSLPRTNGYELAEHMRSQQQLRDVPVLLLSGAFEPVDEARLKASGARGVMEKPLEPTAVISRVKALLGFGDVRPAAPARRPVTPADTPGRQDSPSVSNPSVSSWDELRHESGLAPDAQSVEGAGTGAGRADYLGTLDAAFDSLDLHLAGGGPAEHPPRNPSPPLGQAAGAPDPRSPGRRPSPRVEGTPANTVFEADGDWFAHDPHADTTAAAHDMKTGLHAAAPPRPDTASASPAFETDDEWFGADEKAREDRGAQEREFASEMGIRDLELSDRVPVPAAPAPASELDLDFGLAPVASTEHQTPRPVSGAPFAQPPAGVLPVVAVPVAPAPTPAHRTPPGPPPSVADDFAALLAFETGDAAPNPDPPRGIAPALGGVRATTPEMSEGMLDQIVYRVAERLRSSVLAMPQPQAISQPVPPPQITDAMLQQISRQVADRLKSDVFASQLHDAVAAAVRDTVRSVVSDTSERLVREEIERIKARTET